MKRLLLVQPFDSSDKAWRERREATAEAWNKQESWWRSIGIEDIKSQKTSPKSGEVVFQPKDLLHLLRQAGCDRVAYEKRLRNTQARPVRRLTVEGQHVRRLLDAAKPFVEFMKQERFHRGDLFFENLGEGVEEKVKAYRERYLLDGLEHCTPRAPRHRPGEPWLEEYVQTFALIFRSKGQSWGRTEKGIYDALLLAGHGDVLSKDKVHNMIRRFRKDKPGFGEVSKPKNAGGKGGKTPKNA